MSGHSAAEHLRPWSPHPAASALQPRPARHQDAAQTCGIIRGLRERGVARESSRLASSPSHWSSLSPPGETAFSVGHRTSTPARAAPLPAFSLAVSSAPSSLAPTPPARPRRGGQAAAAVDNATVDSGHLTHRHHAKLYGSPYFSLHKTKPLPHINLGLSETVSTVIDTRAFNGEIIVTVFTRNALRWMLHYARMAQSLGFDHFVAIGDSEEACTAFRAAWCTGGAEQQQQQTGAIPPPEGLLPDHCMASYPGCGWAGAGWGDEVRSGEKKVEWLWLFRYHLAAELARRGINVLMSDLDGADAARCAAALVRTAASALTFRIRPCVSSLPACSRHPWRLLLACEERAAEPVPVFSDAGRTLPERWPLVRKRRLPPTAYDPKEPWWGFSSQPERESSDRCGAGLRVRCGPVRRYIQNAHPRGQVVRWLEAAVRRSITILKLRKRLPAYRKDSVRFQCAATDQDVLKCAFARHRRSRREALPSARGTQRSTRGC